MRSVPQCRTMRSEIMSIRCCESGKVSTGQRVRPVVKRMTGYRRIGVRISTAVADVKCIGDPLSKRDECAGEIVSKTVFVKIADIAPLINSYVVLAV